MRFINLDPSVFCRNSLKARQAVATKDAGIEVGVLCKIIKIFINSHQRKVIIAETQFVFLTPGGDYMIFIYSVEPI